MICPSDYFRHTNEEFDIPTPSSSFWHPISLFNCILFLNFNSCEKSDTNQKILFYILSVLRREDAAT